MEKKTHRLGLWHLVLYMVLASELAVLVDLIVALVGQNLRLFGFAGAWMGGFVLALVLGRVPLKKLALWIAALPVAAGTVAVMMLGMRRSFAAMDGYSDPGAEQHGIYGQRDVMVLVPHQDDEMSMLGGVLDLFCDYGSQVRVVFTTNGDFFGIPQVRMQEAVDYCRAAGIPRENLLFLGYGDKMISQADIHLYNAPAGEVQTSRYGKTETYGVNHFEAYHPGNEYTSDGFLEDLESVILNHRPRWIFCIDYDKHIDHQALSLGFEKVMGRILEKHPEYTPVVLKAYTYNTAWYGQADFYRENIGATENPFEMPESQDPRIYHWDERIRFPVDGTALSRSLVGSEAYKSLSIYESQDARYNARGVINGDRTFWQRRTDSLLKNAQVSVTSGKGDLLHDFMLLENTALAIRWEPYDGVWIPDPEDAEKTVSVTLSQQAYLDHVVLYDHPSQEQNVLDAVITLDDGTTLHTGPLHTGGAATVIPVGKTVGSFTVCLTETQGEAAGITELEAFASPVQGDVTIVKLQDAAGDFAYDYMVPSGGEMDFTVYTHGVEPKGIRVWSENENIRTQWEDGKLKVNCPKGESGVVAMEVEGTGFSDRILVRNPRMLYRFSIRMAQKVEEFTLYHVHQTVTARGIRMVKRLLE